MHLRYWLDEAILYRGRMYEKQHAPAPAVKPGAASPGAAGRMEGSVVRLNERLTWRREAG
jgi:hypothetical protein